MSSVGHSPSPEDAYPSTREGIQGVGPFDSEGQEVVSLYPATESSDSILRDLSNKHREWLDHVHRLAGVFEAVRQQKAIRADRQKVRFLEIPAERLARPIE